jgi:hypothetical protein
VSPSCATEMGWAESALEVKEVIRVEQQLSRAGFEAEGQKSTKYMHKCFKPPMRAIHHDLIDITVPIGLELEHMWVH